jgi:hypothetical protein
VVYERLIVVANQLPVVASHRPDGRGWVFSWDDDSLLKTNPSPISPALSRFLVDSDPSLCGGGFLTGFDSVLQKKNADDINKLQLVMKSGKYTLSYKIVLKTLRSSKGMNRISVLTQIVYAGLIRCGGW